VHPDEVRGWSRAAQDAAESLTVIDPGSPAPQPFLKRRMGYSTTGAFLAIMLFLLMIVTFLLVVGADIGPIVGPFSF
jgi:hypothetical protein